MKQPTKAIICAAGLGTRFLPQTKAMPKEILHIDRPVIQVIVEQAVAAGVTSIIVTGGTKRAIEDHFDRSDELEAELREKGKHDKADEIKRIAEMANFVYLRQKGSPRKRSPCFERVTLLRMMSRSLYSLRMISSVVNRLGLYSSKKHMKKLANQSFH